MNTKVQTRDESTLAKEPRAKHIVAPRCDIHESDKAVFVTAEMPGVSPDAVEVTLERNVLTIRGRSQAIQPEGLRLLWREFEPVDYRRSFELTAETDGTQLRAALANGLLRVEVPKRAPEQRRIQVHAG